jgi:hypothetical protein
MRSDGLPCLICPACGGRFGLAAGTSVLLAERLPDPFVATCPHCERQSSYSKESIQVLNSRLAALIWRSGPGRGRGLNR